jgi:hypothetical protein
MGLAIVGWIVLCGASRPAQPYPYVLMASQQECIESNVRTMALIARINQRFVLLGVPDETIECWCAPVAQVR